VIQVQGVDGQDPSLHSQLIATMHSTALGGHSGVPITYSRLKQTVFWKGMKKDVHQFVQNCQVYIQAKSDRAPYPGKLQPLPIPSEAWETISMDFIEGLPHSSTANCILVIVDKFTKFAHFIPPAHPYMTSSIATAFMNMVYKCHGLPTAIISD
jgi:hypothetical protein